MNYVTRIVEAFGGVRAMARKLDRPVSTVQGWKVRGSIPDEQKPRVLQCAQAEGVPLTTDDFFPTAASEDAA